MSSQQNRGEVRIKGEEDAPKRGLLLIGRGSRARWLRATTL